MPNYANNTKVSSEHSRLEIEKILMKYGAVNSADARGITMDNKQAINAKIVRKQSIVLALIVSEMKWTIIAKWVVLHTVSI